MSKEIRTILAAELTLLGLALGAGGIIVDKNGAIVIGLCVAGAAAQQWIALRKQAREGAR